MLYIMVPKKNSARQLKALKVQSSSDVTDKAAEIPMGTNQAYETVDARYASAGKGTEQDEAIYEMPVA